MESCYQKKKKKNLVKSISGNTTESLCLLRSTVFTREFDRTLECVVSSFFMMTHLLTSSCTSISQTRTLKLRLTFPPLLAVFDSLLFLHLKKCLAGRKFNSGSSLGSAIFQCFHIYIQDRVQKDISAVARNSLKVCCTRRPLL